MASTSRPPRGGAPTEAEITGLVGTLERIASNKAGGADASSSRDAPDHDRTAGRRAGRWGARVPPSSGASSVDGAAADAHQTRAPHGSMTGTWDVGSSRYNSSVPPSDDERGGGGLGGGGGDAGSVYSLSDASELSAAPGYRPACDKYTAAATRADSVAYTLEQHRLQLEATIRSIDNAQAAAAGGGRGAGMGPRGGGDDGMPAAGRTTTGVGVFDFFGAASKAREGPDGSDPGAAKSAGKRRRGRGGKDEGGEEPYTFMGCCGGRS